jgi:hypothetical protein
MAGAKYKAITFAEDYADRNVTFEQFKAEFKDTWVFKEIPEKERESEFKKAFKIATKKAPEKDSKATE